MALWIQNVSPQGQPNDELHDYILWINRKELARFQAVRSKGAANCLRAAAEALDHLEGGE